DVMERKCVLDPPRPSDFTRDVPADLEALCVRLLAREVDARADDAEVSRALALDAPSEGAAFVGRGRELEAMRGAWSDVAAGGSVAVVLEGESGVGKSALAHRFVASLRESEPKLVVLEGRCHE